MEMPTNMSRRTLIAAGAAAMAGLGSANRGSAAASRTDFVAPILVAYFSRSGNTRVIAGQIQRDLNADLFEIEPARAYPADYEQTVEQARRERDAGIEPALKMRVSGIARYNTLFLGFPIWGETAPPIIRSFLRVHDLTGKTVRPFITHGGYGLGNSIAVLKDRAPGARLAEAFSMQADQERKTVNEVRGWLSRARPA